MCMCMCTWLQVEGTVYSGEKIDIWSCGIILYIMVTGVAPFQAESPEELLELIRYGQYVKPTGIDEGCEEILAMTLQVQQNKRPTAVQLVELEWIQVCMYVCTHARTHRKILQWTHLLMISFIAVCRALKRSSFYSTANPHEYTRTNTHTHTHIRTARSCSVHIYS
jgi:serine/threonine protein kinase